MLLFGVWLLFGLGCLFFLGLAAVLSQHVDLFTRKQRGRYHALLGLVYLFFLVWGLLDAADVVSAPRVFLDLVLGLWGALLAFSATEFGHKGVKNVASGTLDPHATVTHSEMIEHVFYQLLNAVHALYLHAVVWYPSNLMARCVLCLASTTPWLLRSHFPVNRFSDNYTRQDPRSNAWIRFLYRMKKYQYVFLKHGLQQGLLLTIAVRGGDAVFLSRSPIFRMHWVLMATMFVMEFFLQTLVKKDRLSQQNMLRFQHLLMATISIAAGWVFVTSVSPFIAMASAALNFANRGHDMLNTTLLLVALVFSCQHLSQIC